MMSPNRARTRCGGAPGGSPRPVTAARSLYSRAQGQRRVPAAFQRAFAQRVSVEESTRGGAGAPRCTDYRPGSPGVGKYRGFCGWSCGDAGFAAIAASTPLMRIWYGVKREKKCSHWPVGRRRSCTSIRICSACADGRDVRSKRGRTPVEHRRRDALEEAGVRHRLLLEHVQVAALRVVEDVHDLHIFRQAHLVVQRRVHVWEVAAQRRELHHRGRPGLVRLHLQRMLRLLLLHLVGVRVLVLVLMPLGMLLLVLLHVSCPTTA